MEVFGVLFAAVFGGLIGSVVTACAPLIIERFSKVAIEKRELETQQKGLLREMLEYEKYKFRSLSNLSNVIGATEDDTKRLLISIGARGSSNGVKKWALLDRAPLPKTDEDE